TSGLITLYEGNFGTQNIVQTFSDAPRHLTRVHPNDEARSLVLNRVRAGAVITVYDSSSGSTRDDYCIIRVGRFISRYVVNSFEHDVSGGAVTVEYHHNNGLDGKVSAIKIT